MQIPIHSVGALGAAVRAVRKTRSLRQDDTAGGAGVGHVFLRELEHGKETVQFGLVLKVLEELGIEVTIDIPDAALDRLPMVNTSRGAQPAPLAPTRSASILAPLRRFKKAP
ncbi:transcriptional regulator [Acidovorax sp.]|uniref:transcriptional regulator n=1 Tax=Acidovorax sp. TaxID=1872122 RepID=UPI00391F02B2